MTPLWLPSHYYYSSILQATFHGALPSRTSACSEALPHISQGRSEALKCQLPTLPLGSWVVETGTDAPRSACLSAASCTAKLAAVSWNLAPLVITFGRTTRRRSHRACDSIREKSCWNIISKAEKVEVITINYAYDCLTVIGVESFGSTFPPRMQARKSRTKWESLLRAP